MSARNLNLALALSLLALSASARAAEDRFGLEAGSALPLGSLKTAVGGGVGLGLGLHVFVDLGGGHALRPRLEDWRIRSTVGYTAVPAYRYWNTLNVAQGELALDYLYFFEGTASRGPYLLAGPGLSSNRIQVEGAVSTGQGLIEDTMTRATRSLAVSAGGGYQFTPRFGVEARYHTTRAVPPPTGGTVSLDTLNLVAVFRF